MKSVVILASGVTSLALAVVFFDAVLIAGSERPIEYEVMFRDGVAHICDVPLYVVDDAGLTRPEFFCGLRAGFTALGAPVETPDAMLQLIVPVMFVVIGVRLLARAITSAMNALDRDAGAGKPRAEAA